MIPIRRHSTRLPFALAAAWLAAALACAGPRGEAALKAEPDSLAFDPLAVGALSAPRAVLWSNESADTVRLAELVVSGPAAADFVLSDDLCGGTALAPGGTCSVAVLFAPREPGPRRASLAPGSDTGAAVALTGAGTEGTGAVAAPAALVRSVPETLDFGEQPLGIASGPLAVRLVNQRQGSVQFAARVRDPGAGFRIALDRCSNEILRPGRACTVQVLLNPTAEGLLTGELVLRDLNGQRDQAVPLTGTGVLPGPEAASEGAGPAAPATITVSVAPRALEFGLQPVGTPSAPRGVTIRNMGAAGVVFRSLVTAGDHPGDFRVAGDDCRAGLVPTRSCTLQIVFEPSGPGPRSARIEARTDTGTDPALILLSGTGGS